LPVIIIEIEYGHEFGPPVTAGTEIEFGQKILDRLEEP
jgi:hypothetical protein